MAYASLKKLTGKLAGDSGSSIKEFPTFPFPMYPDESEWRGWDSELQLEFVGFVFLKARAKWNDIQNSIWVIPYWSIVLPLTALSAYLLLSKPRQVSGP
jgi:hypothetical protein